MTCAQVTDTVVLHANKMDINTRGVKIVDGAGKTVHVSGVSFVPAKEFMYVKSSGQFKAGDEYVLTIPFAGNITDDLVGYYRSNYVDKGTNQTRYAMCPSTDDIVLTITNIRVAADWRVCVFRFSFGSFVWRCFKKIVTVTTLARAGGLRWHSSNQRTPEELSPVSTSQRWKQNSK